MARQAAQPSITDLDMPSTAVSGDPVDIAVQIEDDSASTAEGEDYNIAYVHVASNQHDLPVLWACTIIQPGQTKWVGDSTGAVESLDGEFTMPTSDTDLTIEAGGYNEADADGCADALNAGTAWWVREVTIRPVDPDKVSIADCSCTASGPDGDGDIEVIVGNQNDDDAEVYVRVFQDGNRVGFLGPGIASANGSGTLTGTVSAPSGGWVDGATLSSEIANVDSTDVGTPVGESPRSTRSGEPLARSVLPGR